MRRREGPRAIVFFMEDNNVPQRGSRQVKKTYWSTDRGLADRMHSRVCRNWFLHERWNVGYTHFMKAAMVDGRRRLLMPPECPPNSAVTIQQVDDNTWIIKRQLPDRRFKMVLIPVVEQLPEDPEWEKTEAALARSATSRLAEPQ